LVLKRNLESLKAPIDIQIQNLIEIGKAYLCQQNYNEAANYTEKAIHKLQLQEFKTSTLYSYKKQLFIILTTNGYKVF
jgi:hypothetical protein